MYELRFIKKQNRQFVTLRSMISYDKDEYDGYFFRNGCLVVLYGTKNAPKLLDYTWIKKNAWGIPNFRHQTIKDWNYPYPLKFEILSNGHIKNSLSMMAFQYKPSLKQVSFMSNSYIYDLVVVMLPTTMPTSRNMEGVLHHSVLL